MNLYFNKLRAVFRLKVLLPLAILTAACAGSYVTLVSAPKARMRPPQVIRQSVETRQAVLTNHRVVVDVMGTVTAAREIVLKSQVSGKVVEVSPDFVPGGFFEAGESILNIDAKDYELAVQEVEAEVTGAEYDLKVEQGYQKVSAREWALLQEAGKSTQAEADLALRKPHLAKAQADLRAARAKLERARIDLSRTKVAAPFAAMVESKDTDLGAAVAVQGSLATLVGTDEFWIQASVPVDRLGWISLPSATRPQGSEAEIISGGGGDESVLRGRVVRLLPSLEDEGRMARVLIAVKDPLNLEGRPGVKPLLLGSYVSVRIRGDELKGVYAVPRAAFHDNSRVWVLADDGTLDIRTVDPVWKDEGSIVIRKGLAQGERIVMSDLAAPVQGMLLNGVDDGSDAAVQSAETPAGTTGGEADNG
ncbi:efflux RND transporter periplasmic adaptor subunit [Pseudodesulfovibrio methanolicus]|uniref:Efflux RND transporter periplasmic adaptor subunit n=1 Tax=Pseudodesulfovibrio methanolicus TaxID=3126690 RepID=A0ABZ2IRN6_9BACT